MRGKMRREAGGCQPEENAVGGPGKVPGILRRVCLRYRSGAIALVMAVRSAVPAPPLDCIPDARQDLRGREGNAPEEEHEREDMAGSVTELPGSDRGPG